ncbi:hypothetical protein B0T25DRAFT_139890 [Lasiosphaeria hispida]|uniref:Uncharacterized protein n=1 Tax=Lasiosphaeria hispida TaxID=260671 RepID=A0AAJ0MFU4_9PEZI|nr:hypothetical protein B0T25DRAFT_139890 [Lasiosphaeria hispida]
MDTKKRSAKVRIERGIKTELESSNGNQRNVNPHDNTSNDPHKNLKSVSSDDSSSDSRDGWDDSESTKVLETQLTGLTKSIIRIDRLNRMNRISRTELRHIKKSIRVLKKSVRHLMTAVERIELTKLSVSEYKKNGELGIKAVEQGFVGRQEFEDRLRELRGDINKGNEHCIRQDSGHETYPVQPPQNSLTTLFRMTPKRRVSGKRLCR